MSSFILCGCHITLDPVECYYDNDCGFNEVCIYNSCEENFNYGGVIEQCNCYDEPIVLIDTRCYSGYSDVFRCNLVCSNGNIVIGRLCI